MITHQNHDHDHDEISAGPHTHLTSVGIDIGSSTSHLMLSQLRIGYPSFHNRRPEVLERKVIARSPILLTPFSGNWDIQAGPLQKLVEATFKEAGLNREAVDTGAVIITGEAARRDNASRIAELFSDEAGRFVCATAGPKLESIMAAHGSGAVHKSREEALTLLNVDLGGGTTKISLIVRGRIRDTTAVNMGARLIAYDQAERLTRIEKAGARFLEELGRKVKMGEKIEEELRARLAARMARALFDTLTGEPAPWEGFFITEPLGNLPKLDGVLFSGGVSEYVYGRETALYGDLGQPLGRAIRKEASERGYTISESGEGIRATVIGASQYSIQLSGETIFIPDEARLPLRNLRVFTVHVDWEAPVAERTEAAVRQVLDGRDPEVRGDPFVLAFSSPPFFGYGATQELAKGIDQALATAALEDRPGLLVFEQNVGRVVGEILARAWNTPCVDEVKLSDLDFIDVGEVVKGESFVPVVIKSLAFGA